MADRAGSSHALHAPPARPASPTVAARRPPRSFAIVTFADAKYAARAIRTMDGTELDGRNINVRPDRGSDRGSSADGERYVPR